MLAYVHRVPGCDGSMKFLVSYNFSIKETQIKIIFLILNNFLFKVSPAFKKNFQQLLKKR